MTIRVGQQCAANMGDGHRCRTLVRHPHKYCRIHGRKTFASIGVAVIQALWWAGSGGSRR